MARRVVDALFKRCEIAAAFGDIVPILAAPDPALIVTLQKVPDHVAPFVVIAPALTASSRPTRISLERLRSRCGGCNSTFHFNEDHFTRRGSRVSLFFS
jgi:hypothetical protein